MRLIRGDTVSKKDAAKDKQTSVDSILAVLLSDRSSGENLIWATDNYKSYGEGFQSKDHISAEAINGERGCVVKPRNEKSKEEQIERIRQKAEVFTPSWVCNKQNNLIDNAWFEEDFVFNTEGENVWKATTEPISFPSASGKSWQDYVLDTRLEITCGEAPYIVSRYDGVTGEHIAIPERIGLLDRKLRVVSENCASEAEWVKWATAAFQNTYGFDWQGDNVILARNNLMLTFIDYYKDRFDKEPSLELLGKIAEIVSWNIWQMDGQKFVIPESCKDIDDGQFSLFDDEPGKRPCEGCTKNDPFLHTGIYCQIKDWKANKTVEFVSLLKNGVG